MAYKELASSLGIINPFIKELNCNKEVAIAKLNQGHILATDIANQLCESGIPFRNAYKKTATFIKEANETNKQVHDITKQQLGFDISFATAVEKRKNNGGTSRKKALLAINNLAFDTNYKNKFAEF
ncbi:MAG: hypothetical protein R3B45_10300 [Bdellovibrionota bacterium]